MQGSIAVMQYFRIPTFFPVTGDILNKTLVFFMLQNMATLCKEIKAPPSKKIKNPANCTGNTSISQQNLKTMIFFFTPTILRKRSQP